MTAQGTAQAEPAGASVPPVSAVVVNYNGERYLRDTLAALGAEGYPFAEVLLVDDASSDGSLALAQRWPGVRVLVHAVNRGPAAARNTGYRAATCDLILSLDNDVSVEPGCTRALVRALAAHPLAVLATPRVLYAERPDTIQYEGAICHFTGVMAYRNADLRVAEASRETCEIDSMLPTCFLVDRARLGPRHPFFDEDFGYMLEDHDLALRTRIAGHVILSVPAAVCRHGGGTEGMSLRLTGRYAPVRVLGLIRNRWLVLAKNYADRTLLALAPAFVVYEIAQLAVAARKGWLPEWRQSLRFLWRSRREILRRRREVQTGRVVPDRRLLRGGPLPFSTHFATGRIDRAAATLLDRLLRGWWSLVRELI